MPILIEERLMILIQRSSNLLKANLMSKLLYISILSMTLCNIIFAQENILCPNIKVTVPSKTFLFHEPMPFSVSLDEKDKNLKLGYKWTISEGLIEEGQNTSAIIVETAGLSGGKITATVEITGLPPKCPNTFSAIGLLEERPPIMDPGEMFSEDNLFEKLNYLAAALNNNPTAKTFITIQLTNISKRKKINRIFTYLNKNHLIAKGRILFGIRKSTSDLITDISLVPFGAELPEYKDCQIIRGEDLAIKNPVGIKRKIKKSK